MASSSQVPRPKPDASWSGDTEWDDGHHRTARSASITTDSNGDASRAVVSIDATADLAVAQAVPDDLQATAHGAAADSAA